MSDDKLFVASAEWVLDRAMVTGRYSCALIREIDAHIENGTANIFPVFEEIGASDGSKTARPSRTKPADLFKGRLLKGLWHKHYTQARFMRENWSEPPTRSFASSWNEARAPATPGACASRQRRTSASASARARWSCSTNCF